MAIRLWKMEIFFWNPPNESDMNFQILLNNAWKGCDKVKSVCVHTFSTLDTYCRTYVTHTYPKICVSTSGFKEQKMLQKCCIKTPHANWNLHLEYENVLCTVSITGAKSSLVAIRWFTYALVSRIVVNWRNRSGDGKTELTSLPYRTRIEIYGCDVAS